jgi:hypothetical protein
MVKAQRAQIAKDSAGQIVAFLEQHIGEERT